jgi:dipeptidase D
VGVLEGLRPEVFWRYFADISRIPRPSGAEERVAQFVVREAESLRLEVDRDEVGNVLVRMGARPAVGAGKPVCVQCHLDMVCERRKGVQHDFHNDAIRLCRRGDWLTAQGTTLGADNGVGVAACLALMADPTLHHGPLELLFTVDEEAGASGVLGLRPDWLQARMLINLDSERDGTLCIGCAGGRTSTIRVDISWEEAPAELAPCTLSVAGLRGGHSGLDIHHGRACAIRILHRGLRSLGEVTRFRIADIAGGGALNAIAREAAAVIYVSADRVPPAKRALGALRETIRDEFRGIEAGIKLSLNPAAPEIGGRVMARASQRRLLDLLAALPHGVVAMSSDWPGVVQTSTNLARVRVQGTRALVSSLSRSNVPTELTKVVESIRGLGRAVAGEVQLGKDSAGWSPNPRSPLLRAARNVSQRLLGRVPRVEVIHAGLECAVIGRKVAGMDMLSLGPTVEGAHTPGERLQISTVPRYWTLITGLLRELSRSSSPVSQAAN